MMALPRLKVLTTGARPMVQVTPRQPLMSTTYTQVNHPLHTIQPKRMNSFLDPDLISLRDWVTSWIRYFLEGLFNKISSFYMCKWFSNFSAALKREKIIKFLLYSLETLTSSKESRIKIFVLAFLRGNFRQWTLYIHVRAGFRNNFLQSQKATWKQEQTSWRRFLEGFSLSLSDFKEANRITLL